MVAGLGPEILVKRDSDKGFPVNFEGLLRTPFSEVPVSQNMKVYT